MCHDCELEDDLKKCALKHIGTARKLLATGELESADRHLRSIETHLREK
ncbi:MAG: hypothetical protein ACE5R6_20365 [Candidatus Heimdallarchaeota archaeon]